MLMLTIASLLVGAMLGQHFKALVLVPASALAALALAGAGVANDQSVWSIGPTIVLIVTALQMGYLGGAAGRFFAGAQSRTSRASTAGSAR